MSAGPGRVQRWLIGYVERWEGDEGGYVSKNFLRAGWDLHEREDAGSGEHPIAELTYTALDDFEDRAKRHPKRRSHRESARRSIAQLSKEGIFEESPDGVSVRIAVSTQPDDDLEARLAIERQYLKVHGHSASEDLIVAVTGNIVVIELERRLSLAERMSFDTRCLERGDSPTSRVQRLVDYAATKSDISEKQALAEAFDAARKTLARWREEDL